MDSLPGLRDITRDTLRFYRRRGFTLVTVHASAADEARKLKPSMPMIGNYGIAVRDEIEMERIL